MSTSAGLAETAASEHQERLRCIEDFGQLFERYGVSLTVGRVFGLLLMSDVALSLDDMALQLTASKSGVSVAARDLERLGVVRRNRLHGSRRITYEASDNFEPIFEAQFDRIRQQLAILRRADSALARGRAKARLRSMKALHEFWLGESEGLMARWRAKRAARIGQRQ